MQIVGWIVGGLVLGIVAKFLMEGGDPGDFVIAYRLTIGRTASA